MSEERGGTILTSFLLSRYGCEVKVESLDGGCGSMALASTSWRTARLRFSCFQDNAVKLSKKDPSVSWTLQLAKIRFDDIINCSVLAAMDSYCHLPLIAISRKECMRRHKGTSYLWFNSVIKYASVCTLIFITRCKGPLYSRLHYDCRQMWISISRVINDKYRDRYK